MIEKEDARDQLPALSERRLAIYLRDHHAAGSAGKLLAARAARSVSPAVEREDDLSRVAREIEADLETLEEIMRSQGIKPSAVKDSVAVALERLGRLKLNGRVFGRSQLSDVVELETLLIGITGKAALWRSLGQTLSGSEQDFVALVDRAQEQIDVVSRCRDRAVITAFGGAGTC